MLSLNILIQFGKGTDYIISTDGSLVLEKCVQVLKQSGLINHKGRLYRKNVRRFQREFDKDPLFRFKKVY